MFTTAWIPLSKFNAVFSFKCKNPETIPVILQDAFSGVDRLFLIPPAIEFSADIVSDTAAVAKEANVNHVVLSAPSAQIPPTHKYLCLKGSFYFIEKKVRKRK